MSISDKIKSLQKKPYEERVKLLWIGTVVALLIFFGLWYVLSRAVASASSGNNSSILKIVNEQVNKALNNLPNFRPDETPGPEELAGLPKDYKIVQIRSFSKDPSTNQLILSFAASNPSNDIMLFLKPGNTNIHLQVGDGEQRIPLTAIDTNGVPFPAKILSGLSIAGKMTFPMPPVSKIVLLIEEISMETRPEQPLSQSLELDLDNPASNGSTDVQLPRE